MAAGGASFFFVEGGGGGMWMPEVAGSVKLAFLAFVELVTRGGCGAIGRILPENWKRSWRARMKELVARCVKERRMGPQKKKKGRRTQGLAVGK